MTLYGQHPCGDEQWAPIPGWEGLYTVSDRGRVMSLGRTVIRRDGQRQTINPCLRKIGATPDGYPHVRLVHMDRSMTTAVHRLVMAAFVGPRPEGMEVRHLNGVKTDCRLANLAYGTRAENMRDLVAHGAHGQKTKTHCRNGHPYAGGNLHVGANGHRVCRKCRCAATVRYQQKQGRRRSA